MDQASIQQQLFANTPLETLYLTFSESAELLLQTHSGMVETTTDKVAMDDTEAADIKRLYLGSPDESLILTLDVVTPAAGQPSQASYMILSVQDLLANVTQCVVQDGKAYKRLIYNEAIEDPEVPSPRILEEPANRITMANAIMRLHNATPVRENQVILHLPQLEVGEGGNIRRPGHHESAAGAAAADITQEMTPLPSEPSEHAPEAPTAPAANSLPPLPPLPPVDAKPAGPAPAEPAQPAAPEPAPANNPALQQWFQPPQPPTFDPTASPSNPSPEPAASTPPTVPTPPASDPFSLPPKPPAPADPFALPTPSSPSFGSPAPMPGSPTPSGPSPLGAPSIGAPSMDTPPSGTAPSSPMPGSPGPSGPGSAPNPSDPFAQAPGFTAPPALGSNNPPASYPPITQQPPHSYLQSPPNTSAQTGDFFQPPM